MASNITNGKTGQVVDRILDLPGLLRKKSHFLLEPRQTGKTLKRYLCVVWNRARKIDGISVLPLTEFLEVLWSGEFR
jgi:hypothetical protein